MARAFASLGLSGKIGNLSDIPENRSESNAMDSELSASNAMDSELSHNYSVSPHPRNLAGAISPQHFGGGVSEAPCFTVFSGGRPQIFGKRLMGGQNVSCDFLGGKRTIDAPSKASFGGLRKWDLPGLCRFPLRKTTGRKQRGGAETYHRWGGAPKPEEEGRGTRSGYEASKGSKGISGL